MIELQDIRKRYGALKALDRVSLHVEAGTTTVLIGPSGCGKSTLLRVVVGLIQPDSGTALFDDTPITPDRVRSLRLRMGYVIQDGGLFPHLTARRNVTLMARHLGRDRAFIDDRVHELARLTQFPEDGLDRYPVQLSGGQRQRVSLMRALMLDPDVLLMDEPLGALDPMIRYDLQSDLREIFRRLGKTVLLVTHDMAEAAYFGHKIVLMSEGRIVQQGTARDLVESPADEFVRRFINTQRRPINAAQVQP